MDKLLNFDSKKIVQRHLRYHELC